MTSTKTILRWRRRPIGAAEPAGIRVAAGEREPREIDLRVIDLEAAVEFAASTVSGLAPTPPMVTSAVIASAAEQPQKKRATTVAVC